ncbi:hypothetical protein DFQ27_000378 [Actinomortierella ambigua]|uniref:Uncharacterized protein n=1 Tax=Actinomortierella ambigua TaxID=1343610 RepID=A0A9P6PL09_9FUNG|nr:hypothetical protein DFQ27_000378 [Actinomortierella ambigua]
MLSTGLDVSYHAVAAVLILTSGRITSGVVLAILSIVDGTQVRERMSQSNGRSLECLTPSLPSLSRVLSSALVTERTLTGMKQGVEDEYDETNVEWDGSQDLQALLDEEDKGVDFNE